MSFKVLILVKVNVAVVKDVASVVWSRVTDVSEKSVASALRSTIRREAVGPFETLVTTSRTTQCYTNSKQTFNLCRYRNMLKKKVYFKQSKH